MTMYVKKLIIAVILIGNLVPVSPVYAMDGQEDNDQKEEVSFAHASPEQFSLQLRQPRGYTGQAEQPSSSVPVMVRCEQSEPRTTDARASFANATEAEEEEAKERESALVPLSYDQMYYNISNSENKEAALDSMIKMLGTVDARDDFGNTLLMRAVKRWDKALVFLLLARGADVNAVDGADTTPLAMASRNGKSIIVHLLLDKGANASIRNFLDMTPLMHALFLENKQVREEIIVLLVFAGVDYEKDLPEKYHDNLSLGSIRVMKKAEKAREGLGLQNWSIKRLLDSRILVTFGIPHVIEDIIGEYCDPHVGDKLLDLLIQ